jgi:uncharacterized protein YhaN
MKLLRLDLRAFGPFTDRTLDFPADGPALHLILGANEAGKSSALRALGDLRFGIPMRSSDNFLHPHPQMRIGAVFEAPAALGIGARLALLRRKGHGQTLQRMDEASGAPLTEAALPAGLDAWLGAGLDRPRFEAMFSLDHARLRAGGRALIDGQGELGEALFAASAGSRGVRALLDALDAEARALYLPSGKKNVMAQARQELDDARRLQREATTRPQVWKDLRRQLDAAEAQVEAAAAELTTARRAEHALAELRAVAPLLLRRDQLDAALAVLADAPHLPEDAPEQRRAARRELDSASADAASAQQDAARCRAELARLAPDAALLAHADALRRVVADLAALEPRVAQVEADAAERSLLTARLTEAAARIHPALWPDDLLQRLPGAAEAAALRERADQLAAAQQQLAAREDALRLRRQEHAELTIDTNPPVPADQFETLQAALAEARALGDPGPRLLALQRRLDQDGALLAALLAELGLTDLAALRQARLLLDALIQAARADAEAVASELALLQPERERLQRDLAEQQRRAEALCAVGEPVTAAMLAVARARRDAGWRWLRRERLDAAPVVGLGGLDLSAVGQAGSGEPVTPDDFERAQQQADHQADLLGRDATRAAQWTECQGRIQQMQARLAELAAREQSLAGQGARQQADWHARLDQAGLPALPPAALAEWQQQVRLARERADQLQAGRAERDLLTTQSQRALVRLDLALALPAAQDRSEAADALVVAPNAGAVAASVADPVADLAALAALAARLQDGVRRADERLQLWQTALAAREERQRQQLLLAGRCAEAERQRTEQQERVAQLQRVAAADAQRLLLDAAQAAAGVSPTVLRARLDELAQFEQLQQTARQLLAAQQSAAQQAARLRADWAELAVRLGIRLGLAPADGLAVPHATAAPLLPPELSDTIRQGERRLQEAQDAEHQRALLQRDLAAAESRHQQALQRIEWSAQQLRQLCTQAASSAVLPDEAALPALEERSAQRRTLQRDRALIEQQLAAATQRPLADLRAALADCDATELALRQPQAEQAVAAADAALQQARHTALAAEQALAAIDGSARAAQARESVELAAARWRDALRPWARLRLAQVLLEQATRRFRERAQAPMLARASALFATMTGGRYAALRIDDDDGHPVLQAERAPGQPGTARVGIDALSEGTADQLFLALRLAALDLRRSDAGHAAPLMPLVLDDVLMTADDERAACVLQALAAHARSSQVLLFTHHRHLAELAAARLTSAEWTLHQL